MKYDDAGRRAEEVTKEAMDKLASYESYWSTIYQECKNHEAFALLGKQMDQQTQSRYGFTNARMPNLLKPYINNQANQTLQNNYRAIVIPNGGGASIDLARNREQALRAIQRNGAAQVYNQARRYQLAAGIHYSLIVVDYMSNDGFAKEYRYEDVEDTYNVFPDITVKTCTFADAKDFVRKENVPKAQWKEKTGLEWNFGNATSRQLVYYWRKRSTTTEKQYRMEDGRDVMESDLPKVGEDPDLTGVRMMGDGRTPFSRDVTYFDWEWFVLDGQAKRIITEGEWLGCFSPLVACTGEKVVEQVGEETKVHYYPLTRDAEEPQVMFSIVENIKALRLAKSPYPFWKIAWETIVENLKGSLRGSAEEGGMDILYKSLGGPDGSTALRPPELVEPLVMDRVLLELQAQYQNMIERVLGIYDAAMGEQTNEKSGVAIKERAKQSNLANYHFEHNFLEYVKQMGYVVLESMPKYLTEPQQMMFLDQDDKPSIQALNVAGGIDFQDGGKYGLIVEVVPDGDSTRDIEAERLVRLADSPVFGPIIAKTPGAAAEMLKAQRGKYAQKIGSMIERATQDPEKQQMGQQIQEMQQAGQRLQQELADLQRDRSLEEMKEANRHAEKMAEIQVKVAANADKSEIDAFNAETNREKANGIPQFPNSLPGAPEDLI